jgi:hypothetical protein
VHVRAPCLPRPAPAIAWFTVAGGIIGAMTFGYLGPALRPFLLSGGPGKLTLGQLALGTAAVLIAVLVALERLQPWRDEVGPDVDGVAATDSHA